MDKIHELRDLKQMIRSERIFYANLGVYEDLKEYGKFALHLKRFGTY